MALFGFKLVDQKENKSRFQLKNNDDCLSSINPVPLTVDIEHHYDTFKRPHFTIIDVVKREIIIRKWFSDRDRLLFDLLDNRRTYSNLSSAYHIIRILNRYSIVASKPLDLDHKSISIKVVFKEYEDSRWGGVDKDNHYTTYVESYHFLVYRGFVYNDDYIRKLLPPSTKKVVDSYRDYRPMSDVKDDNFWLQDADEEVLENFKKCYDSSLHAFFVTTLF